ncbi:hypothetical protein [Enteractinococcus coprophilus]|uniref:hypothetical protein n=1 Tax=Enteractinococcus coprophilus TaxID=1027633 RepID=UPI00364B6BB3
MNIEDHLMSKPKLAQAAQWDKTDATLAGGERALAAIVDTLLEEAHRLDAAELTALAETLTAYAQEVQAAEEAGWKILKSRGLNIEDQPE